MSVKLALLLALAGLAYAHVRVWEPTARSTLWRDPRYDQYNPPQESEDDGVYCGRIAQPDPPVQCGVCGDPWALPVPRPHETGGTHGNGIIVANYSAGQSFEYTSFITIPHNGSLYYELCDEIPETDACFSRYPKLPFTLPEGTMTDVPVGMALKWINGTVKLPAGVSARHAVLRLTYRAGYLGQCPDGTSDYGCGPQQHFRACSDVSIAL